MSKNLSTNLVRYQQSEPVPVATQPAAEETKPGLFGLYHLRYKAWLAEGATEAQLRILTCQERMIAQQRVVAEAEIQARASVAHANLEAQTAFRVAELNARRRLAELTLQAEEAESELHLHRRLQTVQPQAARVILGAEIETQKLLAERAQLRRERLNGPASHPPAVPSSPPLVPSPIGAASVPALEVHISDQQIESLALRAVTRFSNVEPEEAEHLWARWRSELSSRLPPYAVQEVIRRTEELRGMMR